MLNSLDLKQYRSALELDKAPQITLDKNWQQLLLPVLHELGVSVTQQISISRQIRLLHGVLATIDAYTLSPDLNSRLETIAAGINSQKESVDSQLLSTIAAKYTTNYPSANKTSIWVGDISQLKADAIVNAANSHLLGCRVPNHACIDNVIHSAAGPRLRDDCATIIELQQSFEEVGSAKITRAYALPASYVIHTVGPQLYRDSIPSETQRLQLRNTYYSCLEVAAKIESIRTIAFCAVSTGLFAFPKVEAATIALETVSEWLDSYPESFDRIIFNLYSESDAAIYEGIINEW